MTDQSVSISERPPRPRTTRDRGTRLSLRCEPRFAQAVQAAARQLGVSVSFLLERSIVDFLEKREIDLSKVRRYRPFLIWSDTAAAWVESLPLVDAESPTASSTVVGDGDPPREEG